MGYLIGVDVGSQSVKAILLDPDGRELGSAGQGCTMSHPASGWAEQDPAQWQAGLAAAVRQLMASTGIGPAEVTHLGLASQVDGVVPVDSALRPLRPAIIWLDRRGTDQAAVLADRVGTDRIFATTGLVADASHIAPKLMWLRDHEPGTYEAAVSFPPAGGYLLGWLTGVLAQDHANASSTLLYDVRSGTWDEAMLQASGVDPGRLAPIRPAAEVAGCLTAEAAAALGLSRQCAVVVGTGDEHGACVGAGAIVPGLVADVTGTAEPVAVTASAPVFDPERVVETHAHAVTGLLLVENPGFVSGGCTLWWGETILGTDQAGMFVAAAMAGPGSDGVLFLPALSGATVPRWNDRMRGVFAGLAMNHDRSHLARAVIEGCTFALRDVLGRMDALGLAGEEIRVVGGGARSELWLQIKADITGRTVQPVLSAEPTALGAAVLAGVAAGTFADAADGVARTVRLAPRSYRPDPRTRDVYAERYAQYLALYDGAEGALA
ncbi:MAG TPA: FGGY family carbohydrate kinase [Streptosporangiaceae bacterium]|nr:FGGY family carbohydrate kinase [Streptosporangiaceae bacterium]